MMHCKQLGPVYGASPKTIYSIWRKRIWQQATKHLWITECPQYICGVTVVQKEACIKDFGHQALHVAATHPTPATGPISAPSWLPAPPFSAFPFQPLILHPRPSTPPPWLYPQRQIPSAADLTAMFPTFSGQPCPEPLPPPQVQTSGARRRCGERSALPRRRPSHARRNQGPFASARATSGRALESALAPSRPTAARPTRHLPTRTPRGVGGIRARPRAGGGACAAAARAPTAPRRAAAAGAGGRASGCGGGAGCEDADSSRIRDIRVIRVIRVMGPRREDRQGPRREESAASPRPGRPGRPRSAGSPGLGEAPCRGAARRVQRAGRAR
jgi:hypothetical protein